MNKKLKKLIFTFLIIALFYGIAVIAKVENMYSLATETTETSTTPDKATNEVSASTEKTSEEPKKETSKEQNKESSQEANKEKSNEQKKELSKEENKETKKEENKEQKQETKKEENKEPATSAPTQEPEKEKTPQKLEFYSSELTPTIISSIIAGDGDVTIKVDGTKNISKSLFDALKGSSRTLTIKTGENEIIFKGRDIKEAKNIDASISISLVENNAAIKELTENGIVITFPNNGELPGNATIRIKVTNDIKSKLDLSKKLFIYFYNENNKKLEKENVTVKYEKDYIEFVIDHNSEFVLIDEEIAAKESESTTKTTEDSELVKEATSSNNNENTIIGDLIRLLVTITIVFFIIVIVIIVIVMKIKKSKKKNKVRTEEYGDEDDEDEEYDDEENDEDDDDDEDGEDDEDDEDGEDDEEEDDE